MVGRHIAGQHENACADDGADTQADEVYRAKRTLKFMIGGFVLNLPDGLLDQKPVSTSGGRNRHAFPLVIGWRHAYDRSLTKDVRERDGFAQRAPSDMRRLRRNAQFLSCRFMMRWMR
jgi:hypothetical protein